MTTDKAVLGAQPFLRGMADDHVAKLAALCTHIVVPAGQRVFEEGSMADRFWLIDAGQVTTDTVVPGGGRLTITVLGRGDVLNLSGLVPPYRTYVGAMASQPMQAYEFDAHAVRAACEEDPALGYELSKRVSRVLVRRLAAVHHRLIKASEHAGTSI
jgi:CRP/FNR family transcriptional regulator, cyclic AMP receptor protein